MLVGVCEDAPHTLFVKFLCWHFLSLHVFRYKSSVWAPCAFSTLVLLRNIALQAVILLKYFMACFNGNFILTSRFEVVSDLNIFDCYWRCADCANIHLSQDKENINSQNGSQIPTLNWSDLELHLIEQSTRMCEKSMRTKFVDNQIYVYLSPSIVLYLLEQNHRSSGNPTTNASIINSLNNNTSKPLVLTVQHFIGSPSTDPKSPSFGRHKLFQKLLSFISSSWNTQKLASAE